MAAVRRHVTVSGLPTGAYRTALPWRAAQGCKFWLFLRGNGNATKSSIYTEVTLIKRADQGRRSYS
jgi:hypothetical protein